MGNTQKTIGAVLIFLALGLAGYAWVLSERMLGRQQETQPQLQPVVVASTRIAAGSVISPDMVRVAMFPTRPDGAYADVKTVAGKATASDVAVGEPLLVERLEGGIQAMLQHLEDGERAVAVRVDDVVAVGNRLNAGDWVDVYVTLRRNSDEIADTQSRLLLQKLKVLAFGAKDLAAPRGNSEPGARNAIAEAPKNAVLAVPENDVEKLALAAESGRLLLALRPRDKAPAAEEKGDAIKSVAAAAPPVKNGPALTLKDLVHSPRAAEKPKDGVRSASNVPVPKGVILMHGLKERRVTLGTKQI